MVFPARAGMSPFGCVVVGRFTGVPRASGDEPGDITSAGFPGLCSPRERG